MCTVTIIRTAGSVRVACNRDEQRTRPAALPPEQRSFRDRAAILPIDTTSGGTWIAASDAGLVFVLLNVNPPLRPPRMTQRSRGLIIPVLLPCDSLPAAAARAESLTAARYQPFRLVIANQSRFVEIVSNGRTTSVSGRMLGAAPAFFTSSGLGDHVVEPPRRALFRAFFRKHTPTARSQDAFHRHQWPDRPLLSVNMSRDDACTVSYTTVTLDETQATMRYKPDGPMQTTKADSIALPLRVEEAV